MFLMATLLNSEGLETPWYLRRMMERVNGIDSDMNVYEGFVRGNHVSLGVKGKRFAWEIKQQSLNQIGFQWADIDDLEERAEQMAFDTFGYDAKFRGVEANTVQADPPEDEPEPAQAVFRPSLDSLQELVQGLNGHEKWLSSGKSTSILAALSALEKYLSQCIGKGKPKLLATISSEHSTCLQTTLIIETLLVGQEMKLQALSAKHPELFKADASMSTTSLSQALQNCYTMLRARRMMLMLESRASTEQPNIDNPSTSTPVIEPTSKSQ